MEQWTKDFYGISVEYREKLVRIKNDEALIRFLDDPDTKGALLLADHILERYQKEIGRPLKITRDSLAIEILGHVYLDKVADMAGSLNIKGIQTMSAEIKGRTDVIDCGEKDIDSNRVVWDTMEEMKLKTAIYAMCGKGA